MLTLKEKMPRENVFHFIGHYYDSKDPITGGEKYDFRLVETMQRKGYSLILWTDEKIPGIFKKHYLLYDLWYIIRLPSFQEGILFIDDYMHPRLFLFIILLKHFTNIKVIGIVHHLYWPIQRGRLRRRIDRILERTFISHFDVLIVPSEYTLKSVRDIVRNLPSWRVISPGIERKQLPNAARHLYIAGQSIELIFVGAIQQRKGVLELVEALGKVTYPDAVLHLVGDLKKDPDYVAKVKETIDMSGLQNRVRFHGRVSHDELYKMYQSADIFVLPSFHEGYGIVVVEAMQFGLPVIVSNITALPELVQHGVNGLLVSPGDVEGIAQAIDQLSMSPEDRKRMAAENLELARKANSWEDVEDQFVKLVTHIMER